MDHKSSAVETPLQFYLSALAFAGGFVVREYSASPWREILIISSESHLV
jgi:hypothetical protein